MKMNVINYVTCGDYEAERDDPSAREMSITDFASPQFHCVCSDTLLGMRLDGLKHEIEEELVETCTIVQIPFEWQDSGWVIPAEGRMHRVLTCGDLDEPYAVIVVQSVEAI